ncbi:MAG: DUF3237 domain-containing protein [Solirubrobacteraceae bacterium]
MPGEPVGEKRERGRCWQVATGTLTGPRITATLAMPGTDWIRLGSDGIRRQDLRAQFLTDDGELILMRYDVPLIRSSERFLSALAAGEATEFGEQYMRMAPVFEVGDGRYHWLRENVFVAEGRLTGAKAIAYDIYRVL